MSRSLREDEAEAFDETDWFVRLDGWDACLDDILAEQRADYSEESRDNNELERKRDDEAESRSQKAQTAYSQHRSLT